MRGCRPKQFSGAESENIIHIFSLKIGLAFAGPFLTSFWARIDPMDTKHPKIELLTIFADVCKKHPAHRAPRPATGRFKPFVRV